MNHLALPRGVSLWTLQVGEGLSSTPSDILPRDLVLLRIISR